MLPLGPAVFVSVIHEVGGGFAGFVHFDADPVGAVAVGEDVVLVGLIK